MKKRLLFMLAIFAMANAAFAQVVWIVENPSNLAGPYDFTYTDGWGADLTDPANAISGKAVLADDGSAGDSLACGALINGTQIAGNIAVIYRGNCEFGAKALNAQDAGAKGVIIINGGPANPGPDELLNMGAGAVGAQVTIPVTMISMNSGAKLRAAIDAGTLMVFIGNKTGLFATDVTIGSGDVIRARSFAIPKQFAQNGDFNIPVGSLVINQGSQTQNNITLNAKITLGSTVLYSESQTVASLGSTDTVLVELPPFTKTTMDTGFYRLTYTVTPSTADEFPGDNQVVTNFWINEGVYSKSRIDSTRRKPLATAFYRPAAPAVEFSWCIIMDEPNAGSAKAYGMSVATTSTTGTDLTGKTFDVEIQRWNDDISTEITFNDLEVIASRTYTYSADLQQEFVRVDFFSPVTLVNNERYLACINVFEEGIYVGTDAGIDYSQTIQANQEYYFPLKTDQNATWGPNAFGAGYVPALLVHTTAAPVGLKELAKSSVSVFPNPASNLVTLSLDETIKGNFELNIFDITGRIVKTESLTSTNNSLQVNTSALENGTYIFRVVSSDKTISSFPVVINK